MGKDSVILKYYANCILFTHKQKKVRIQLAPAPDQKVNEIFKDSVVEDFAGIGYAENKCVF
jgi:hypothetical protein